MIDVLISEFMDIDAVKFLKNKYKVHYDTELWENQNELKDLISKSRSLIVRNATQVNKDILNCSYDLKGIVRLGVGLDNIDLKTCRSKGIKVFPAVGANANSVAEYVVAISIMLLRNHLFNSSSDVLRGNWDRKKYMNSREIFNKTIGIIGFGSIGQAVADKANLMGMKVLGYDNHIEKNSSVWLKGKKVDLTTLLATSDIVTLHCPLLPETKNLISEKEFKIMKKTSVLINAARGGVVNERDCLNAINNDQIFGAALDTLAVEPISSDVKSLFSGSKNLFLTPHIAGVTEDSNKRIAEFAVEKINEILN